MEACLSLLKEVPAAWLVVAMSLLPLVGVPVSPLWILAGLRLGTGWGIAASVFALAVNDAAAHQLAARWLGKPIRAWLQRRRYSLPALTQGDETKLILVCRLTPGFPLPIQNYLLGCAQVNFTRYLLVSLPIQAGWASAFVYFGDALTRSKIWPVIMAACLFVVVVIVIALVRKRMGIRPQTSATP